ncbi:MAG: hypothetical protein HY548_00005, partial [Elusimicrobia bacterium]|nr:hypothetical protein [Elusimicrobiota bacterium]
SAFDEVTSFALEGMLGTQVVSAAGEKKDCLLLHETWTADFADAYNVFGQQQHYREILTRTYGADTVGGSRTVDREWKAGVFNQDGARLGTGYNGVGQLADSVETSHVTVPDVYQGDNTKIWGAKAFDSQGRVVHYEEKTNATHVALDWDPEVFSEEATKIWKGAYDDAQAGLLNSFEEENFRKAWNGSNQLVIDTASDPADHSKLKRSNMGYTPEGFLLSYDESGYNTSSGNFSRKWSAVIPLDPRGRALEYTEDGFSESGGVNKFTRSNIEYNDDGFMTAYHDEGVVGNQYVRKDWGTAAGPAAPVFDVLGRLKSWEEAGWTDAGKYERAQSGIAYNGLSQTVAYTETGASTHGTYTKLWSNGVYGLKENMLSYHQKTTDGFGKTTESDWTAVLGYNSKGQLLGYHEEGTESDGAVQTHSFKTDWAAKSYNSLGQQEHFTSLTEKKTVDGLDITVTDREWSHGAYHADGRLKGYRDTVKTSRTVDTNADGQLNGLDTPKESVSTTVRANTRYYTQADETAIAQHIRGMTKGYEELQIASTASEKPVQIVVDGMAYDTADGRLLDSLTVSAEENLVSGIIRRLRDWVAALTNTTTIVDLTTSLLTLGLASLLAFGKDALAGAKAWLTAEATDLTVEEKGHLESFLDILAQIFTWPLAIPSLMAKVTAYLASPGQTLARLTNAVTTKLTGVPFFNLPTVPEANTAYSYLKPFDFTATVTQKTNVQYDTRNRPVTWKEVTRSSAAKEKIVTSDVRVTYEGDTQRQATYEARTHETGKDEANRTLDKISHIFRTDYQYDPQDQAKAYKELIFEGDALTLNDISTPWTPLSPTAKAQVLHDILDDNTKVKEILFINDYKNVRYNSAGQMTDYDLTSHKRGLMLGDLTELSGALESFNNLSELVTRQETQVGTAETDRLAAKSVWDTVRAAAETEFAVTFADPDNVDAVINTVAA